LAKGRMLQNRISKSNKMAALSSDTVRLLYTWLLAHLDINGNFYADPVMVNNLVLTRLGHSVKTISYALDELEANGLIVRYVVDGEQYLNYPDFFEKQPKLQPEREGRPEIPNITPELLQSYSRVTPTQNKIKEDKIREDKEKYSKEFLFFWKAYPKKSGSKKAAYENWKKLNGDKPAIDVILSAIKAQIEWRDNANGKFRPEWKDPERWIKGRMWEAELDAEPSKKEAWEI
jgi:hypothetical protein